VVSEQSFCPFHVLVGVCLQRVGAVGGGSGGFEGGDPGWRLDLERGQDRLLGLAWGGRLLDGAGGTFERDEVEALQLGRDPSPAVAALAFGDPDQEQREPADDHVRVDAVLEPVEDGPQLQGGLEVAEGAFGLAQVLVAKRDLLRREVGVAAGEQVLAIEALLRGDPAAVDLQAAAR